MNETTRAVDVAVIGAGSAGLVARRQALAHGAKRVLLIEGGPYGTTCARVGCMPSKLLIAAADAAHEARRADEFGVHAELRIDGEAVMARVRRERDRFAGFVVESNEKLGPDEALRGWARFVGPTSLLVSDGDGRETRVEARTIIVATGSTPSLPPPLRDLGSRLITTDQLFELPTLPGSLAVVGTGVIGLEIGQAMHRLGVRTRCFDIAEHLTVLPSATMRQRAQDLFADELDLNLAIRDLAGEDRGDRLRLTWTGADGQAGEDDFDYVLAATGRRPRLERLHLTEAGVALDSRGMPKAWDPRTAQIGEHPIFMVGDVDNYRPLLHEAAAEGRIAGINAARWPAVRAQVRQVPLAIMFTDPQVAVIGRIPAAEDEGRTWEFGEVDLRGQGRARVMAVNRGWIRVYGKHACGTILGAEIVGPRAEHLAHLLAWGIEHKLSAQRALALPYYHPVIEEGLRTAMQDLARKLKMAERARPLDCGPGA